MSYEATKDFPSEICFNGSYLTDIVNVLEGEITLSMQEATHPAVLTADGSPEIACIIMGNKV